MPSLVRAACLTHYVEVAREVGLDPWQQLARAGLDRRCVDDPERRIPVEAVRKLLETSAALSGTEAFGLRMAEGRRLSNLGAVGLLSREAPTLRAALQAFERYGRLHNEALVQRIEESGGIATIHEELLLGAEGPVRQSTELAIAVTLRLIRVFLGGDWRARRICFTHAEPMHLSVHRRVLGQTPEFRHEFNGIVCTSDDLDTPIASADPVMAAYIRQQLQVDARVSQQPEARTLHEAQQMIVVLLPQGRCSVEQVAQHLAMTRRTLHRHLAAQGTTFVATVCAIRHELASRYVCDQARPLTEVAQLLGFANLSAFSRWHRSEFGRTAASLRLAARRPMPLPDLKSGG